jgi:DNA polymerase I-like protein with 3'-5' exonuclease and polymerase domains
VSKRRNNVRRQKYSSRSSYRCSFILGTSLSVASNVACNNIAIHDGELSHLLLELESLGISIKDVVDDLNDDKELDNLAENLKQKFVKEVRKMEEQGLFVNPGGG